MNPSNPTAARTAAENDAIARQWALDHGYQLFSITNQRTGVEERERRKGKRSKSGWKKTRMNRDDPDADEGIKLIYYDHG